MLLRKTKCPGQLSGLLKEMRKEISEALTDFFPIASMTGWATEQGKVSNTMHRLTSTIIFIIKGS